MKHYKQTTNYTCDPACLLMAMHELNKKQEMEKNIEMAIWNESNLVTVPGCLPQGLALSALKQGFFAYIICKKKNLYETTRSDAVSVRIAKRQAMECRKAGVVFIDKEPNLSDITSSLLKGAIPIVLVGAQKIHSIKSPHWIVVSKITDSRVYFHDPLLDRCISLKKHAFSRMHSDIKNFLNKRMLIISKGDYLLRKR